MTHQSDQYGDQPNPHPTVAERISEGATTAVDTTAKTAGDALDQAEEWLKPIGLSIKERPGTALAVVGGIAFAAGALWMLRPSRQQSRAQTLLSSLSNYAPRIP
jgi:hypothetical protein